MKRIDSNSCDIVSNNTLQLDNTINDINCNYFPITSSSQRECLPSVRQQHMSIALLFRIDRTNSSSNSIHHSTCTKRTFSYSVFECSKYLVYGQLTLNPVDKQTFGVAMPEYTILLFWLLVCSGTIIVIVVGAVAGPLSFSSFPKRLTSSSMLFTDCTGESPPPATVCSCGIAACHICGITLRLRMHLQENVRQFLEQQSMWF